MMAAFTASRHFMATLGAPRPCRSEQNGNCSPTRVASSTRCCRRAVAVSITSLLEDRARVQHLMRGCAPTRMSEATTSAAVPMVKELRKRETTRCKHFAWTMAQQTVTQPKNTVKASFQKVDRVNEHSHVCRKWEPNITQCEVRE